MRYRFVVPKGAIPREALDEHVEINGEYFELIDGDYGGTDLPLTTRFVNKANLQTPWGKLLIDNLNSHFVLDIKHKLSLRATLDHFLCLKQISSSCPPSRYDGLDQQKKDFAAMPRNVQILFGYALHLAQAGKKHHQAKPLTGFGGAGVLEIVESYQGNAYRAVYTVRYLNTVYALHCFQKKSTRGIATPKRDIDLIKARLIVAAALERSKQP